MSRTRDIFADACFGPAARIPSCPRPKCRRFRRCHTVWDANILGRWRCLTMSDKEACDVAIYVYRRLRARVERDERAELEAQKAEHEARKVRRRR